jgi:hypothetical protein
MGKGKGERGKVLHEFLTERECDGEADKDRGNVAWKTDPYVCKAK